MLTGPGLAQLALKQTPIDKFLYLSTLRKNNVHLFYRLVTDHLRVRFRDCTIAIVDQEANCRIGIDSPHLYPGRWRSLPEVVRDLPAAGRLVSSQRIRRAAEV
jgi:hypothetical protein